MNGRTGRPWRSDNVDAAAGDAEVSSGARAARAEKSFVESALDPKLRYPGAEMASEGVPKWAWRKGSQWFVLTRPHARLVAEDVRVFEAFERHCKIDGSGGGGDDGGGGGGGGGGRFCAPDEHYVPTLLTVLGRGHELEGRGGNREHRCTRPVIFSFS